MTAIANSVAIERSRGPTLGTLAPAARDVSVILTTRNRAAALAETLKALATIPVPANRTVEFILVDNGSTDATAELCREARWSNVEVSYLHVAAPGLGRAQNVAIRQSRGKVLLFTDDDVHPPANWIAEMTDPILNGSADAVGGGVRIPDLAKQPWTTPDHAEWLASTERWENTREPVLVGANMAIGRHLFAAIGGFDEDLSHAPDTLFSWRLVAAGFRLRLRHDVMVEHWVEPARFTRAGLTRQAAKRAELSAFEQHHWLGARRRLLVVRWLLAKWRLARYRATLRGPLTDANLTLTEMQLMQEVAFWVAYQRRSREPRQYGSESSALAET